MRNPIATLVAAATLATIGQGANAQFVNHGGAWGADSFVIDTLSGQTWLNLDVMRGLSYNDVVSQLALDPHLRDFRIAGYADVKTLFLDAGFSIDIPAGNLSDPARLAASASFADAFNGLPGDGGGEFFLGNTLLPDVAPDSFFYYANYWGAGVGYGPGSGTAPTAFTDSTGPARVEAFPLWSTWVVSTTSIPPVPEPSTYALMLAGLAVVGVVARRRKQQD